MHIEAMGDQELWKEEGLRTLCLDQFYSSLDMDPAKELPSCGGSRRAILSF